MYLCAVDGKDITYEVNYEEYPEDPSECGFSWTILTDSSTMQASCIKEVGDIIADMQGDTFTNIAQDHGVFTDDFQGVGKSTRENVREIARRYRARGFAITDAEVNKILVKFIRAEAMYDVDILKTQYKRVYKLVYIDGIGFRQYLELNRYRNSSVVYAVSDDDFIDDADAEKNMKSELDAINNYLSGEIYVITVYEDGKVVDVFGQINGQSGIDAFINGFDPDWIDPQWR